MMGAMSPRVMTAGARVKASSEAWKPVRWTRGTPAFPSRTSEGFIRGMETVLPTNPRRGFSPVALSRPVQS